MSPTINVRLCRTWKSPDWLRQTPGGLGRWGDCQFHENPALPADYTLVCNHVTEPTAVSSPRDRTWLIVQEPPSHTFRWIRHAYPDFGRIYTQDTHPAPGVRQHHGGLPWHVGKTFDELTTTAIPAKSTPLTWITSNAKVLHGHKARMKLLEQLRATTPIEIYGRGIRPIDDKWTALAPARYAMAIESFSANDYWTEKVTDAFLAGSFPLYWGAQNLSRYFPEESFAWIDITDRAAPKKIAEIVRSDLAERRREAVAEARRRVLHEHQFFACMSREITAHHRAQTTPASANGSAAATHVLRANPDLSHYFSHTPVLLRWFHGIRRRFTRP